MAMLIDVHIHTAYSDGRDGVRSVLRVAELKGLDAIAITDHETLRGYWRAIEVGDRPVVIIPGYEIKTDCGHILILGLEELPNLRCPATYEEIIDWSRERGGLSILAHPAVGRLMLGRWRSHPPDAVEALNSAYPMRIMMRIGLKVAGKLGVTATAGSDAHRAIDVGDAYMRLEGEGLTVDEALKAIRMGRIRIGGDISSLPIRLRSGIGYITSLLHQASQRR